MNWYSHLKLGMPIVDPDKNTTYLGIGHTRYNNPAEQSKLEEKMWILMSNGSIQLAPSDEKNHGEVFNIDDTNAIAQGRYEPNASGGKTSLVIYNGKETRLTQPTKYRATLNLVENKLHETFGTDVEIVLFEYDGY